MTHKRLFLYFILILINVVGMCREQFSVHAYQTHPALRLWVLATDDNYQNARMVAFDMADQQITQEIKLPPDLAVISSTWSPDGNYIGAVVGKILTAPATTYGEKVCVFSNSGEQVLCHEDPILTVAGHLPFVAPAPVVWTADSQQLVFVASTEVEQMQQDARIVFLDVKQKTVTQSVEVDFPGIIHAWEWMGPSIQAGVIAKDSDPDTYQLHSVKLKPDLNVDLLATYITPIEYIYFVGNDYIAIRKRLENPDGHSVDVMHIEDGRLVPFQSVELVEYEDTPIPANSLTLSNNGDLLAFTSWFEAVTNEGAQIHLLATNFETGKTSLIGGSPLLMEQLTWSPDDTYIAAKVCAGAPVVNTQCRIEVFSLDGTAISVDTGLPENRDPMWVSIES
jgi:hypothetical protein